MGYKFIKFYFILFLVFIVGGFLVERSLTISEVEYSKILKSHYMNQLSNNFYYQTSNSPINFMLVIFLLYFLGFSGVYISIRDKIKKLSEDEALLEYLVLNCCFFLLFVCLVANSLYSILDYQILNLFALFFGGLGVITQFNYLIVVIKRR